MIPKIIHYCWLSDDKFPLQIQKCFDTWQKVLPDYEFKLWDTNAINLEKFVWVKQAFESKKYAFAADYIRLYALYNYGGIYLDCDVEVLKNFNNLLHLPYFVGTEGNNIIEAGVFGATKENLWIKNCLEYYNDKSFVNPDGTFNTKTLPSIMIEQVSKTRTIATKSKGEILQLLKNGDFKTDLYLFPKEYFCAKNLGTGQLENTSETYCIHHFAMSWIPLKSKFLANFKRRLMTVFGVKIITFIINFFNLKLIKDSFSKK